MACGFWCVCCFVLFFLLSIASDGFVCACVPPPSIPRLDRSQRTKVDGVSPFLVLPKSRGTTKTPRYFENLLAQIAA